MRLTSIRGKFVALGLTIILICVVSLGGFGLLSTASILNDSSSRILSLTCDQEAYRLDEELRSIEASVTSSAEVAKDEISSLALLANREWLDAYLERADRYIGSIARNMPYVYTYYLRLNPEVTAYDTGIFYARSRRDEVFRPQVITDVRAYAPNDVEHVGWYYGPRAAGVPMWMSPYYNSNIDVHMISYVIPLYVEDTFIGVMGMDIDFDRIINLVRHVESYKTGRSALVSEEGEVYYHPSYASGTMLKEVSPELRAVVEASGRERGEVLTYRDGGIGRKVATRVLRNDMILMLDAETSEIDAPFDQLLIEFVVAGILIAVTAVVLVTRLSTRITRRLAQLVDVANKVAEGDLRVDFSDTKAESEEDEVGILARTLETTVGNLRTHIEGINAKAYRDDLTMVRNKAAYSEEMERLQSAMAEGGEAFGLVVFDVNDLKKMNDEHGHVRGDEYLQTNCRAICRVFKHSPVFRVGGDEFVAVLQGGDLEERDALLQELEQVMDDTAADPDPWKRVSMARGLAIREERDSSIDEVFARADAAMYVDKRRRKAGR